MRYIHFENYARTKWNRLLTLLLGLLTSTMGYPCAHAFRHRHVVVPLSVNDFDQNGWLVHPTTMDVEVETILVAIQTALKRIACEHDYAPNYCKHMLPDHVSAVPEACMRNPVRLQKRRRPTGSTRRLPSQFEHVITALDASVRLRGC